MSKKIAAGDTLENFSYNTPFYADVRLADKAKEAEKTALVFLRYYGCTLCQYDIHLYAEGYHKVTEAGGQLLIVLQSDPEGIAAQLKPDDLPFDIICDPDTALYQKYEIMPAASMMKLADGKMLVKSVKAMAAGIKHGAREGDEQQLPALFILDRDLHVTYAHYAKSLGDMPDIDKIAALMK